MENETRKQEIQMEDEILFTHTHKSKLKNLREYKQ